MLRLLVHRLDLYRMHIPQPYTHVHKPTVSSAKNSLVYFISIAYIDHPVWRSHHEKAKRGPPCGYRLTRHEGAMVPLLLHRCVVRAWCNPSGSTVATCLNAVARTRRAARAVQGDVVSVWQVLQR